MYPSFPIFHEKTRNDGMISEMHPYTRYDFPEIALRMEVEIVRYVRTLSISQNPFKSSRTGAPLN